MTELRPIPKEYYGAWVGSFSFGLKDESSTAQGFIKRYREGAEFSSSIRSKEDDEDLFKIEASIFLGPPVIKGRVIFFLVGRPYLANHYRKMNAHQYCRALFTSRDNREGIADSNLSDAG